MITSNKFMGNNPSATRRRRFRATDFGNREYINTVYDKDQANVMAQSGQRFSPYNRAVGNPIPEITRHDRVIKNINRFSLI